MIGLALASAPAAGAKIWFKGMARTVAPGQLVLAFVPGCEGNAGCERHVEGLRVFVGATTSSATPPRPRRFVGKVVAGGKLRFRIPRLPAGRYRLFVHDPFGDRSQLLPVSAAFTIERSSPARL